MGKVRSLTCCVCGGDAGQYEQHWNRDVGYGICPRCAAEEAANLDPKLMESYYGTAGVHYGQPTIPYMGRRYRVMATTRQRETANAFMERTPGASVLAIFDDTTIVMVHEKDLGEPIAA